MPVCGPQAEVVLVPQPPVQHGPVVVVAFLLVETTLPKYVMIRMTGQGQLVELSGLFAFFAEYA